ncbi:MAG: hypothetical protein SV760_04360, partial [Halobacteria archaeon]|nr:hypothetical protein [Halobacteria archaeon]
MGNTQDVTQERGYSVSPTGSDDQIRVVADAHIKPRNFSKKMRDRRRVLPGERVVSGGKIIPEWRVEELKENIGDEDELPGKSWEEIM